MLCRELLICVIHLETVMSVRQISLDNLTPYSGNFELCDIKISNVRDGTVAMYNSKHMWFGFALADNLLMCLVWSNHDTAPGSDIDIHTRISNNEHNATSSEKENLLALSVLSSMSQGRFE